MNEMTRKGALIKGCREDKSTLLFLFLSIPLPIYIEGKLMLICGSTEACHRFCREDKTKQASNK